MFFFSFKGVKEYSYDFTSICKINIWLSEEAGFYFCFQEQLLEFRFYFVLYFYPSPAVLLTAESTGVSPVSGGVAGLFIEFFKETSFPIFASCQLIVQH